MPRTASLSSIRKKIAALQAKARAIETRAKPGVSQVAALVKKYKLTAADLADVFGAKRGRPTKTAANKIYGRSKSALKGKKLAVKYRDDAGNKWSGRGLPPKWLKAHEAEGRKREEFLVK
jgi:DNA-binding protein H-NS